LEIIEQVFKMCLKTHVTDIFFFLYFQVCDECTDLKLEVT